MKKRGIIIILFIIIAGGCSKPDYETEDPFIITTHTPAGPDHYRNMYSRNVAIYDHGKLVVYTEPSKNITIGDDAPVLEAELDQVEVEEVKRLLEINKFWKFKDDVTDHSSVDGSFYSITVNQKHGSKKASGLNPIDEKFNEIVDYVFDLANGEDYAAWKEEIEDYILEMNP